MTPFAILLMAAAACSPETGLNRIQTPPDVSIESPEPLQSFRKGEPTVFSGTVQDTFDALGQMTIQWVLDESTTFEPTSREPQADRVTLDLDVSELELGEHLLQLQATDTDGMEGLVGVPFLLDGAISAPTVTITDPLTGELFAPAEEIIFRGNAVDNNTDPDDLEFTWTSSIDGELPGALSDQGQSVLFYDELSTGTHLITLQATDRDGEVGIDTIEISVGEIIEPAQPGDIVVTELMINPDVADDDVGEWIELYNTAGYAIDLAGYALLDEGNDFFELNPLLVAPNDYVVLCADTNSVINGGVACDGPFRRQDSGALALGNDTDEVILARPDGVVIDELTYGPSWYSRGVAIGLDPNKLSAENNDNEADWCNQTTVISAGGEPGTPGRENDPC